MKFFKILFTTILVCFSFFHVNAQGIKTYEADWKKVDALIKQRSLPKSALEEIKRIYEMAKRDKQDAQVIKALVYMTNLQQENRLDNLKVSINELEKEIASDKEPAASILKSLVAGMYWQYFQSQRYQLYNRTNTVAFAKEDIATWTIEDFHAKISSLYLESFKNQKLLQQTSLAPFDAIITKGDVRYLRPTLYDLLAHQALGYFTNSERDIKKPAYAFQLDNPNVFAPASTFINVKFATRDTLSLHHKALLLYQNVVAFHLNDARPDALVDVDIQRLQFVYRHATIDNKDELYTAALAAIIEKYSNVPAAAQASYLLATHYHQLASRYQPNGDTTYRRERIKARDILLKVVRDSATISEGWVNSSSLLNEIQKEEVSFEIEKVSVPERPFRALVRYRNIPAVHFRLITATEEIKAQLRTNRNDKMWAALREASPIRSWQQSLPDPGDLQNHSVEVKVDALPVGEYILLASGEATFSGSKNSLNAQLFSVSNISYIHQGTSFFVLHRESGQPLPNATVGLFVQEYNYSTSRYTQRKEGDFKTDKNGSFSIPVSKGLERGYSLNISHGKDKLFLPDIIYNHYNGDQRSEKQVTQTFLFNDRSIYRPGQTVYFKGIVINRTNEQNNVATNYSTTLYLRNANWEKIDSLKLTTNDFGSYNGTFILPQNILNGIFYLENSQGENLGNFSVEEYKRPKFSAVFDKVKETYKVGDTITVTGRATAYAGNNIDQATVVYRVVRQPRFQGPWFRSKSWPGAGERMEIAHGTVNTAADGSFTFRFVAIPDRKIDPRFDPVFDYRIHIDVTDAGGETRSADNIVSAGYKSLLLQVNVPERISVDSLQKLSIRTENMNGAFQSAPVTISFYNLMPEQRLVRKRYWEQPDQFVMTKEEFLQHFPIDEYLNETDLKTWTRGERSFSKTDTTSSTSEFSLSGARIKPGFYAVEVITKDKNGLEVKDIKYVELYSENVRQLAKPEYLWARGSKPIEPGEQTSVLVGSSASNVFLIQQQDHSKGPLYSRGETGDQSVSAFQFTNLSNEKKLFSFRATEKDRGGYGVTFFFIKDNRLYQFNDIIQVLWTNKELQVEYVTFRDKTWPGSEEKWKVRITGNKNEKVAAEMLASMYDASLDAFRTHQWNKPNIWPVYSRGLVWQGFQNFAPVQSMQRYTGRENFRSFDKRYDRFIFDWMGDGYGGDFSERRMMSVQTAAPAMARDVAMTESKAAVGNATTQTLDIQEESYDKRFTPLSEIIKSLGVQTSEPPNLQVRKNFAETAFFFPELRTDKDGNIEFVFTAPEALTRWKLQTIAHTKDASIGVAMKEIVTQKELMVQPNMPRFLRQGDRIELSSKIANLSTGDLNGKAVLQLFDAATNLPVDAAFGNTSPTQNFKTVPGASTVVKYNVTVPADFTSVLTWRIVATAGNWSDGEEMTLPVLSNRTLVTETMPLPMRGSGTKTFNFEKLLKAGNSNTLQHHALTVEYTSNPAWYAVQALPYLIEQPTESAEQVWNRYYAASLATKIVAAAPRIRQIFEKWKSSDTAALLSNLQKNQGLKSALVEETPWVLQAKTEEQQKKNIALLFDIVRMQTEMTAAYQKLKAMQSTNGGFVWVKGAPDDRYITQYIVTGIGHLMKLGAISAGQQEQMNTILRTAVPYLDRKIKDDYDNLLKRKVNMEQQVPDPVQIQYLYMRSFFAGRPVATASQEAYNFYRTRAHRTWTKQNKYMQGMIALTLHRSKDLQTPVDIIRSLKETAIVSEELGMYWQDQRFGFNWNWWYAPIETQALLIEAFTEIGNNTKAVDDMRTGLIKHKQTNNWRTGKATAEAVYAFLLQGTDWLTNEHVVQIKLGSATINTADNKTEAGTGYFKQTFDAASVKPAMGNISLTVQQTSAGGATFNAPSWGAVYWQYFENMDKITTASTPLQLSKKLFVEKNTDRGPVLTPITEGSTVSIGDKIKVRVEVRVDRDMEYVHMKDMRASAFEPVNVISGYKWQGGLGYYETTKDVSTSFYFHQLRRGTYVFEYPLFATHTGNFSNGITTIQSFYAPEFSAHSEGVRVIVK